MMTKMMNRVMISTSSFSELEIEAFPGVVHVRVAECDVVHGVVADRTNHLMMMMRTAIGNVDDYDNEYADYDNSNQSLILWKGMMLIMTNMMPMTMMSMTVMSMLIMIIYNDDDEDTVQTSPMPLALILSKSMCSESSPTDMQSS